MKRLLCLLALLPLATSAQPVSHSPDVEVRLARSLPSGPIRLAHDPATGTLYMTNFANELVTLEPPYPTGELTVATRPSDHGLSTVRGLAVGPDGAVYLVGNEQTELTNTGVVRRGTRVRRSWTWEDVVRTEPYPRMNGPFDHLFTAITFSPDGAWMILASGSRTDHGEIQSNDGEYPGLREDALTSALFRLPADARDVLLPNDADALDAMGAVYARGVRNAFDLAWDADGELFGIDNAGDRDDGEELNWLRHAHHYGFPWRMGFHDTPQRFAGYDPDADPLVNPASYAYRNGFFYDDPTYPEPPPGVAFTDPLVNTGPDADLYRAMDGSIRDASQTGARVASFTPHRSPLGLVFDTTRALPAPFSGDGFVLGWTGLDSELLAPFGDEGEDVLHLQIAPDRMEMAVTRIASGFDSPIDAVLVDGTLYVAEIGARAGLWALDFRASTPTEPAPASGFSLSAFPNPARGAASVGLTVSRRQAVRVAVVDALGREVAVLHDGALPEGEHRFGVAPRLAPGVYRVVARGAESAGSVALALVR